MVAERAGKVGAMTEHETNPQRHGLRDAEPAPRRRSRRDQPRRTPPPSSRSPERRTVRADRPPARRHGRRTAPAARPWHAADRVRSRSRPAAPRQQYPRPATAAVPVGAQPYPARRRTRRAQYPAGRPAAATAGRPARTVADRPGAARHPAAGLPGRRRGRRQPAPGRGTPRHRPRPARSSCAGAAAAVLIALARRRRRRAPSRSRWTTTTAATTVQTGNSAGRPVVDRSSLAEIAAAVQTASSRSPPAPARAPA